MSEETNAASRKYSQWSNEDRDLVFDALVLCAKNRINKNEAPAPLRKKRQVDLDYISSRIIHKTPAQVRDYYYRSLKQIDKLLKDHEYSFDTGDADDARAALIFFHKYQAVVYTDLQLNVRDKSQRKRANEWVAERLIQSLKQYKADPSMLVTQLSNTFVKDDALKQTCITTPAANANNSATQNLSMDFGLEDDDFKPNNSPKPTRVSLNTFNINDDEDLTTTTKRRKISESDETVFSDDEESDMLFPSCISPADKLSLSFQLSENPSPPGLTKKEDAFVVNSLAHIGHPNNAIFARTLWDEESPQTCNEEAASDGIQEKLNFWVLENTDESIMNDMHQFWNSYFVH